MASSLPSQDAPASATAVVGTVFDSIGGASLAGAVVEIVSTNGSGVQFRVETDRAGRYRFDRVPAGRYAATFHHAALDTLQLELPPRVFDVGRDSVATVHLAIPSPRVVRRLLCGGADAAGWDGVAAGYVIDGESRRLVAHASIVARWSELAIAGMRVETLERESSAETQDDGSYILCGIAIMEPLRITIGADGHRASRLDLSLDGREALRRDFSLAGAATGAGTASIVGRVADSSGKALGTAIITVLELGIVTRAQNGMFSVSPVPNGVWTLEARSIGYQPRSLRVDLRDAVTRVHVVLQAKAQPLDVVTVLGEANRDVKKLEDIRARGKSAAGTQFMPGNPWLVGAGSPAAVLRAARGFQYVNEGLVVARPYAGIRGCDSSERRGSPGGRVEKHVVVYVDGERVASLEQAMNIVPMKQVLAIEAYPDVTSAPFIWRTHDACAVVAIWTKEG